MTDTTQKIDEYADKMHQRVDSAAQRAHEVGAKASERYSGLREDAGHYANVAQEKLRDTATTGKDKTADALHSVADATRNAAGKITDPKMQPIADYANKAAESLDRWSDTLKTRNFDELSEDLRTSVRANPMVAVGVAAAAGFLLARLFTSGGSSGNER